MRIDLTRSKNMLASKIARETFNTYEQLFGLASVTTTLTRNRFKEILLQMHYVLDVSEPLCDEAFDLMKVSGQDSVALRNLATFLIAVDSIFLKSMQLVGHPQHKRAFGYMADGKFCLENEQAMKKLSDHFAPFYRCRDAWNA
jgi:hypothetical protein